MAAYLDQTLAELDTPTMKPAINPNKVAIFSGAGISAESGLPTFRDTGGLWRTHSWQAVASRTGWQEHQELGLEFYNERRLQVANAEPNAAHLAIASLERSFEVVVITQNVDDLHERAGSTNVVHVHGQLTFARGSTSGLRRHIGYAPIELGQLCEGGSQLRPDVVWFGEAVQHLALARQHIQTAARVLVIGTSLSVNPAAALVKAARNSAHKVLIAPELDGRTPYGFRWLRSKAVESVPVLVGQWLDAESR